MYLMDFILMRTTVDEFMNIVLDDAVCIDPAMRLATILRLMIDHRSRLNR
jgi:small nuclear ribonucleoprotein (snRNP)-like protein